MEDPHITIARFRGHPQPATQEEAARMVAAYDALLDQYAAVWVASRPVTA